MRLVLVRHGETDWNRARRIQGISDLEMNETGREQAEALARALRDEKVEAIYTSPLKRARDTAHAIGRHHQVEIVTLFGLRELDAGEVDGLTYKEMATQYGDFLEKWMSDCSSVRPPGGCTLPELQEQVWSAIEEILKRQLPRENNKQKDNEGVVLAVTHFFPILSIISRAIGLDLSECRRLRLDLASLCTLDFNPSRTVLVSFNDTCHLREGTQ
ncbi:MAG: histidine phosphatase family protein [Dehalococcoidia bacterium]|nr:MAG: histidine phosphatase family protein [Dehalococcoidia bacterium]